MEENIDILKRKIERAIKARKEAEAILESKALELYKANEQLKKLNDSLEIQVEEKTKAYFNSENKYQQIIESMELGLLEVDLNDIIVKAYSWFCDMTGYEEKDLVGKNANEVLLAEGQLKVLEEQTAKRLKGQAGVYELQIKKKNGGVMWALISGAPVLDPNGEIVGTIGIHLDITKRKKLEQDLERAKHVAEKAQKAEKQFLANMSHEIRTPLNAIIGMSHLLYDTQPSPQQLEYLDMIQSSADLLHRLISDILDISKIESGKMEVRQHEFDLVGLIKSLEKTFQLKLEDKPVEVIAEIDPAIENLLIGDDLLLNQILLNLLGNAEKFTESGTISINAKLLKQIGETQLIEFAVCDSGIGIEKEKLKLIFKNFKQADLRTSEKYGGTGLGLAISKKLVELQGGKIEVKSEVAKGTCFIFFIPYLDSGKKPFKATKQVVKQNAEKARQPIKGMKVLIAEDNYMNRKYISGVLNKWEITYDMAVNGREVVELSKKQPYDVILMDIQMPVMDGYEATILIRNSHSPNQFTPIVALTASALIEQKYKSEQLGMNDFLTKPFTPKQLLSILSQYNNAASTNNNIKETNEETNTFKFSKELDVEYLIDLYDDDLEHAAEMFDTFLNNIVPEVPQFLALLNQEDWSALSKLAHKLKPTFSMVGLTSLEKEVFKLEMRAKENPEKTELSSIIGLIFNDLEKFKPILKQDLEKLEDLI